MWREPRLSGLASGKLAGGAAWAGFGPRLFSAPDWVPWTSRPTRLSPEKPTASMERWAAGSSPATGKGLSVAEGKSSASKELFGHH